MPARVPRPILLVAQSIAAHPGVWVTVDAGVVAAGAVAISVGVTEHTDTSARPTLASNVWFSLGVGIVLVGVALLMVTVAVLVRRQSRTEAFSDALGSFARSGRVLYREHASATDVEGWVTAVYHMIREAVGDAEAELFLSDSNYVFGSAQGLVDTYL